MEIDAWKNSSGRVIVDTMDLTYLVDEIKRLGYDIAYIGESRGLKHRGRIGSEVEVTNGLSNYRVQSRNIFDCLTGAITHITIPVRKPNVLGGVE
jgi:hypothetical protein